MNERGDTSYITLYHQTDLGLHFTSFEDRALNINVVFPLFTEFRLCIAIFGEDEGSPIISSHLCGVLQQCSKTFAVSSETSVYLSSLAMVSSSQHSPFLDFAHIRCFTAEGFSLIQHQSARLFFSPTLTAGSSPRRQSLSGTGTGRHCWANFSSDSGVLQPKSTVLKIICFYATGRTKFYTQKLSSRLLVSFFWCHNHFKLSHTLIQVGKVVIGIIVRLYLQTEKALSLIRLMTTILTVVRIILLLMNTGGSIIHHCFFVGYILHKIDVQVTVISM